MIRLDRNGVNDRDSCLFVDAALSVMINNERAAADEIHEDVFTVFQLSVMKRCGLILLLLSGYVMVCHFQSDQLVRQLHLVDLQKSWNDAQQYCRDEYIDLAIVNSSALIQEAQKWAGSTEVWIGLSKSDWKWSRLGPFQSSWFPSWSPGQPGTGECVTISSDGSWSTRQCSEQHSFFCFIGECFGLWNQGLTN
ncbi:proteoglycan 3-like [Haplochromis burtoni]|uniref:proteoglycan 3-like n=1 Tax=Haplochromis burtoni TaxID=8153 RepID=UPI001C2D9D98|nr:proteoglycan 3-like [Haplochromis burtoni]